LLLVFLMIQFPPQPQSRYAIRTVTNFFEHSRRYSQIKVDHRYQRHRHLKKGYSLHVLTASVGRGERDTQLPMQCTSKLQVVKSSKVIYVTIHVHRQLLMVLFLLYDIEKSYVNAGMSEYRRKVSPTWAFLSVDRCLSPASVFRHKGSVRYRLSRDYSGIAQLWSFDSNTDICDLLQKHIVLI
jgi:hypothetical protein